MKQLFKCCAGCWVGILCAFNLCAQPNVTRIEYYLDNDPGYGKATAVSFIHSNNVVSQTININPLTLAFGVHFVGIRARDSLGHWSLDNSWVFAKPYPPDSAKRPPSNLVNLEYYIDKDPGYGKGTPISFTHSTNLSNFTFSINPLALTTGVHILGLSTRYSLGHWSLDNLWVFARPYPADSARAPAPNLTQVEYYIDKDPGYGKGVPIAINPVTN